MADAGVNDTGSCVVPICSARSEGADREALMVVAGCLRPEQGDGQQPLLSLGMSWGCERYRGTLCLCTINGNKEGEQ